MRYARVRVTLFFFFGRAILSLTMLFFSSLFFSLCVIRIRACAARREVYRGFACILLPTVPFTGNRLRVIHHHVNPVDGRFSFVFSSLLVLLLVPISTDPPKTKCAVYG